MPTERMLTGDRPTGKLHVGHYVGSIKNRVELQHRYESFFIIADLHMLTTKNSKEDIAEVAANARAMVLDWLAAGIEPELATCYLQSAIPEVCEINTINLSDDEATVRKKVGNMYTDPKRIRADIPGTVEGNPVFLYHDVFNPDKAQVEDLKARYREIGRASCRERV